MRAILRTALVPGLIAISLLTPRAAAAITLDQVVTLAKAGVTDAVILAMIDRDRTVFAIEPEQVIALQRDGLSEKIVLALLKSGREEGEQAARSDAALNSAWIMSSLDTEPRIVAVGHGPDRPNTPHVDGFYSGPPTFRYRKPQPFTSREIRDAPAPRALCYATISTQYATSLTPFVTECPAIMQPRRR